MRVKIESYNDRNQIFLLTFLLQPQYVVCRYSHRFIVFHISISRPQMIVAHEYQRMACYCTGYGQGAKNAETTLVEKEISDFVHNYFVAVQ